MYKIIISSLLTLSLSSVLLQADNLTYSFVGGKASVASYDGTTAPSLGIKYGKQADMWRTTLSLDYSQNGSHKLSSLLLQADKGVLSNLFKDSKFKPYVGFSLGMIQYKNNSTASGYGYGLNTGLTYILNNNIDLDFGIQSLNVQNIDDLNSINNLIFSIHYFY